MDEGLMRHLRRGSVEALSTGTNPQGLNPMAVEVMREMGINISHHESKPADCRRHV
jgi:arsenate reductase